MGPAASGGLPGRMVVVAVLALAALWPALAAGHKAGQDQRLPVIGPAPEWSLVNHDGRRVSLADLRGKVVAVTFIYTTCADTCPLLTAKMARIQSRLGQDFGARVRFVSVTVDPERDTPAMLERYAKAHGARLDGWAFVTGPPEAILEMGRRYGVYMKPSGRGDVDHTFLTSLVDATGALRVQDLGVRFDPEEMLADLRALLREGRPR